MAQSVDGVSPEVLRQQWMKAQDRIVTLEAELAALNPAHPLLVEVAGVVNHADIATEASPVNQRFDPVSRHQQPGSREPRRDRAAVDAWKGFERAVRGAIQTYESRKENNWQRPAADDGRSKARVRCGNRACSVFEVYQPKYFKAGRDSWIENAYCNGTARDDACRSRLKDV